LQDKEKIKKILVRGREKAMAASAKVLTEVRKATGLAYEL